MSIQVQNIRKTFGNFVAIDNLTLDFPSGELVALLGPSGCGKTTLLRIIAGLEVADKGNVLLDGEDASNTNVRERQVGFVFQHYALFRHMTVFENVAFGLRVKPRHKRLSESEIQRKVHELLNLVQLDWLSDRFPAQLSGGQRQRIALARALAVEPRVLLLDEPFGALDAKVRKELRRWLRRLHDELRITSIFVTHDQEEALEVADRVIVLNHGKIEQVGTPDEVYDRPASPFVYSFLGAVNLFHGRVDGSQLRVGDNTLEHKDEDLTHGSDVVAFVRPHELDIVVDPDGVTQKDGTQLGTNLGIQAKVWRILTFGGNVRVELTGLENELENAATPQHYEVELSRREVNELKLVDGQVVRLVPSQLRVFQQAKESRAAT